MSFGRNVYQGYSVWSAINPRVFDNDSQTDQLFHIHGYLEHSADRNIATGVVAVYENLGPTVKNWRITWHTLNIAAGYDVDFINAQPNHFGRNLKFVGCCPTCG